MGKKDLTTSGEGLAKSLPKLEHLKLCRHSSPDCFPGVNVLLAETLVLLDVGHIYQHNKSCLFQTTVCVV